MCIACDERFPGPKVDANAVVAGTYELQVSAVALVTGIVAVNWALIRYVKVDLGQRSAVHYQWTAMGIATYLQFKERALWNGLPRQGCGVPIQLFRKSGQRAVVEVLLVTLAARCLAEVCISQGDLGLTPPAAVWLPVIGQNWMTLRHVRQVMESHRQACMNFARRCEDDHAAEEAEHQMRCEQHNAAVMEELRTLAADLRGHPEDAQLREKLIAAGLCEHFADCVIAHMESIRNSLEERKDPLSAIGVQ
jgi:hypothetical protein